MWEELTKKIVEVCDKGECLNQVALEKSEKVSETLVATESVNVSEKESKVEIVSKILALLTLGDSDSRNIHELLEIGSQAIILYGPPGTGKTYQAMEIAKEFTGDSKEKMKLIQFHPSYSYEDFIGGIKPVMLNNNIGYEWQPGDFTVFCRKAEKDSGGKYIFIIDEINRANLSAVLGPVLYCLEYRGKNRSIDLYHAGGGVSSAESQGKETTQATTDGFSNSSSQQTQDAETNSKNFFIPKNVYVIGTMNNVDKSLVTFDIALRRRFAFFRLGPDMTVLEDILRGKDENDSGPNPPAPKFTEDIIDAYVKRCRELNERIADKLVLEEEYEVGHAYFMKIKDICAKRVYDPKNDPLTILPLDLQKLWNYHILPLLEEYLGQRAKVSASTLLEIKKNFCRNLEV